MSVSDVDERVEPAGSGSGFELGFVDDGGLERRAPLAACAEVRFEDGMPVRVPGHPPGPSMTSPRARTRAAAGPYRPVPAGREGKMLSRQEAAQARRWRDAGWPVSSIARHLRRSPTTIRAYLKGNRQPG